MQSSFVFAAKLPDAKLPGLLWTELLPEVEQ